jgi:hypothetical protein
VSFIGKRIRDESNGPGCGICAEVIPAAKHPSGTRQALKGSHEIDEHPDRPGDVLSLQRAEAGSATGAEPDLHVGRDDLPATYTLWLTLGLFTCKFCLTGEREWMKR